MPMAKLSQLFTRSHPGDTTAASSPPDMPSSFAPVEPESEHETSARLGQACESLRNLIIEAGCKANDLEEAKQAFFKIVDPAEQALRSLEQEKIRSISLNRALTQVRADRDAVQGRFNDLAKTT